jgi:hypothetical protein
MNQRVDIEQSDDCGLLKILAEKASEQYRPAETRPTLGRLWKEICELPLRQRVALLLALKDGEGLDAVSLLGNAGVATMREISEVLEMKPADLAAMWDDLPLDDAAIAERLGIARQQVINLRKSARQRLAYRMGLDSSNRRRRSTAH